MTLFTAGDHRSLHRLRFLENVQISVHFHFTWIAQIEPFAVTKARDHQLLSVYLIYHPHVNIIVFAVYP